MLTPKERALVASAAEDYPPGTPADAWGWGDMRGNYPEDVGPEVTEEYG